MVLEKLEIKLTICTKLSIIILIFFIFSRFLILSNYESLFNKSYKKIFLYHLILRFLL